LAYLRQLLARTAPRHVGHNPAGSQAIFLILILGVTVCVTGVFTQGGEEQQSAAAGLLSIAAGWRLKGAHQAVAILMLLLVIGHVVGIAVESRMHAQNLPLAMITGFKNAPDGSAASRGYPVVGGLMVAATTGFGVWWFFYALHAPLEQRLGEGATARAVGAVPNVAFVGRPLPDDPLWREECGSCHLAFHPNLLPARSWVRLMAEQDRHFGSDLALQPAAREAVLAFLLANAAEHSPTEAAFKISRSIPPESTPVRITQTPYWIGKHDDIDASKWRLPGVKSRTHCGGCHEDAEAGTFEDAAMRIPR
jgi:hypothetical protein